jgi:glutamate-1-semialdehyde 2,1-aminomutase
MAAGHPPRENKTFCILPWIHLAVLPEGSSKLCCVASACIHADGAPLSLESQSLEEIWNGSYLRRVRRDMAAGRTVPDCINCYRIEKSGGISRRLLSNARWAAELGPLYELLLEEARQQDQVVSQMPLYYQLMPGNLCNLKCRMCFPVFSSQIERDPVHRQWVPELLPISRTAREPLDWTQGRVQLAPQVPSGVELDGFHGLEKNKGQSFRWTNGTASVAVPLPPGVSAESLRLRLGRGHPRRHRLCVRVNDTLVSDQILPRRGGEQTIRLPHPVNGPELMVRLESSTFQAAGDPRELGVAVELLELLHTGVADGRGNVPAPEKNAAAPPALPGQLAGRLPAGPWYRDNAWVREVLLQNADRLRGLYFTGGEPMIEKQVEHILDHLIARRVAGNVVLEFNTNCTILREAMVQKLLQFKEVHIALSIDASGPFYEYIRYPSKWDVVRRNVEKLVALAGSQVKLAGGVVLQVYNALNLVEILEFFDGKNIPYRIEIASLPWFLATDVLPARARKIAADRLRAYATAPHGRCSPEQRAHLLSIVRQMESVKDKCTPEALRTLMLFTNDLDASRRQSIHEVHGELLQLLEAEGFRWTDERSDAMAA